MAVREMAPSVNALEHLLVRWLATLAGFEDGSGVRAGGTLTSGGTEATFTALLAARARALPDAWEKGVGAEPPAVVYGAQAHYAVTRAIGELGLGLQAGFAVPLRDHAMDFTALRETLDRLQAAKRPVMAVVATAGTTATGAYDDLEAIGAECERRGLWLHVDGAHGASALLSGTHRRRLAGLARASSIAWDPHKMMLLPLSAGLLLVRKEADLEAAFAQRAPYLFHHDAQDERIWDQGVRSFQCSRRTDAIKVWLALQRYGADGIGHLYDRLCDTAQALHAKVAAHPRFETLHEPQSNILCFRYLGAKNQPGEALDRLNFDLRRDYNKAGEGWITTTLLEGKRVLRVTIMNPRTEARHLDLLLEGLARTGATLEGETPLRPGAA
jgi:L-2,4-diaminobutyrate decarboxylase